MTKTAVASRVLVVHADDEARTFIRRRLAGFGYDVVEAAGGAKALALIEAHPFDLVLLDLQTPSPEAEAGGEGGLDLLRQMRRRRSAAELPILAIAPEGAAEDVVAALALGADDCLQRPLQIDVAQARSEMLIRRREGQTAAGRSAKGELLDRLADLEEAAVRTEAVGANLQALGHDVTSPINGLLGATSVITTVCRTANLQRAIERIEVAAAALDMVMVRALGRADRRNRAPKAKIRVLLADKDTDSRCAVRDLLHACEIEVELIEAAGGLEAALLTDTSFFDLIVMNLAAPRAIAGIQAIRRSERKTKTRRTPILAFGTEAHRADKTFEAGADLHMYEPITAERLLSALAEALARQSAEVAAPV
jgi:DNA-binding response OmpR family regulator